jgi:hypothetical protein
MKNIKHKLILGSLFLITTFSSNVYALPMFERQTGLTCKACHLQQDPKLSRIGRDFLLSGMTLSDKISDTNKSDSDIQASIMFKSRYEKTSDKPDSKGVVSTESPLNKGLSAIPKTASVMIGGRINEDLGVLVNTSYKDEEDHSLSGRLMYSKKLEDGYLGLSLYSFGNFGPFSGVEPYNTGLYKANRNFEAMKLSNINQTTKIGSGKATGIQVYYVNDFLFNNQDRLFASIGGYTPSQDNADIKVTSNFMPLARIAYEYKIGDFNFILGGYAIVGGVTSDSTQSLQVKRETYGVDLQLEGVLLDKKVSLAATKVLRNDVVYTGIGAGADEDSENMLGEGYSVETYVNLTNDFGVKLAYLNYDDELSYEDALKDDVKDIDTAITVGLDYSFNYGTPMKVSLEHYWADTGLDRVEDYKGFVATLNVLF